MMHAPNTIDLDYDARLLRDVNSRHAAGVTRTDRLRAMRIAP